VIQEKLVDHTDDAVLAEGASVRSVAEAKAIIQTISDVSTRQDLEEFVSGFTEDCVVQLDDHPEICGREALRALIKARRATANRQNFSCEKRLRCLSGNVLGCSWHNRWTDPTTGKAMEGPGLEFWIMRDGKIARWDGSAHGWPAS